MATTGAADVVVVGGGVTGTSTAFHLTKLGVRRVTLLERGVLGGGATGKSGALVRMHYTNPHDAALAQRSLPYFQGWGDLVGAGDPRFVETGVVRLVEPRHEAALAANVAMLRGVGVDTCLIDRDELRALDPGCQVDDVDCAAWEPRSGYADPSATAFGFAAAARERGAELRVGAGAAATAILVEGERVVGVATADGAIATETVVVAAGAWAPGLLAPLGLDYGLRTNRVQVAVVRRPAGSEAPHPTYIDGPNASWIRPEGEFGTLAGLAIDEIDVDPDAYDEGVDDGYAAETRRRLSARRPGLAGAVLRGGWAGVITMSPDAHAIIGGLDPYRGLFGILGDSGTNFKTAPAIGAGLAEAIVGGAPRTIDLHPFRASRFAEGQPLAGEHEYGDGPLDVFR